MFFYLLWRKLGTFPITEKLLENRPTLKHFPIMFIRLDIVNYGSPICCVLHQPQCLVLMHLHCNPRTLLCQVFHKPTMKNEPLFTASLVLPSASWISGLERQVNMGSSSHCAQHCCGRSADQAALPYTVLSSLQSFVRTSSLWRPRRTWSNIPGVETSRVELSCTWPVPQWVKEM